MNKWKDESSYSRGTKNRVPTVLAMGLPYGVKLAVHRKIHAKDYWFYSIQWNGSYLIQDQQLNAVQVEDAQWEAIKRTLELLHGWSKALEEGALALAEMVVEKEKQ